MATNPRPNPTLLEPDTEALAAQDPAELAQMAREFGYGLIRATPEDLRLWRAKIAATRDDPRLADPELDFVRGVVFALCEVAAAYGSEMEAIRERGALVAAGSAKPIHLDVLRTLNESPARPSDPACEPMKIKCPCRRETKSGSSVRATRNADRRFKSSTSSQSCSELCGRSASRVAPMQ